MDLSTATPREIDTALGEIYVRLYTARREIAQIEKWVEDYEKGLEAKASSPFPGRYSSYTEEGLDDLRVRLADAQNTSFGIRAETLPYDEEFDRRGGWSRFWLVTNNGGHIHSSMHCSTCRPTTEFAWLPEVSGKTEAEAVAEHGAILCTVCFPSAPVEWTQGKQDDSCPGSGRYYDSSLPHRSGYVSGNWAECPVCHTNQTLTSAYKIRKHK
jgi:hypothetical protein